MRVTKPILGILLAMMLLAGCTAKSLTAGPNDDGRSLVLANGGELVVELQGNPSTGYGWQVVEPSLGGLLERSGDPEFAPQSGLVGAGGLEKLRFKAVKAGTTALRLEYKRPWETTAAPEKTYSVTVQIR